MKVIKEDDQYLKMANSGELMEIPDYPHYFTTKDGRIWSVFSQRYLKPQKNNNGHLYVYLYKKGKKSKKYIHRLILETYVGPCPEGMESCHNNGICDDNCLENLRWDTHKNNGADSMKHGILKNRYVPRGSKAGSAKLTEYQAKLIFNTYHSPEKEWTQYELADWFGVSQRAIWAIVNKRSWVHIHESL
jgi:hypothetical protein